MSFVMKITAIATRTSSNIISPVAFIANGGLTIRNTCLDFVLGTAFIIEKGNSIGVVGFLYTD